MTSPETGPVRVAVVGAAGRMGRMACAALEAADDLELVARIGRGEDAVAAASGAGAQVAVDLTVPSASPALVSALVGAGVHVVVGTSGWDGEALARLRSQVTGSGVGVVVAPNFAIGAVLMVRFAEQAARWFTSVEVLEAHHPAKVDAPSGTAVRTAELVAAARSAAGLAAAPDATTSSLAGARGAGVGDAPHTVPVHSLRVAGVMAAQEVWLGSNGETLVLRHDAVNRSAYAAGLLLAVREVASRPGLTVGLEHLLGV